MSLSRVKGWVHRVIGWWGQPRPRCRVTTRLHLEVLESRDLLSAGDFRIVNYNIASSGGVPRAGLETILEAIGAEVVNGRAQPIDILALQEVQSQATTTQDIVNRLNAIYGPGTYARGSLDGATTGFGRPGVVYNSQTLQLLSEVAVGVSDTAGQPRQAIRHQFHPIGFPATADFYVYNSHYDAGSTTDRRLVEAMAIRADAATLGSGAQVIYLGDYNVLTHSEDGYQHLLSPGPGQAFDPLARPTRWRDDEGSLDILTQTPAVAPPSPLIGGGLDDRFDQQLITETLFDGSSLEYRYGSLHSFGNNGSVPLNGNVNDPSSTALPNHPNRIQLLNLLTTVTDHLPVVADYTVNIPSAFTVKWLEPTRTGFTVYFDRPFDPTTLNLHDIQMGGWGPADLTVVGQTTGPVKGSGVVGPDANSLTFVRTGSLLDPTSPVLPSDTYTLTFRSAADGFRDTGGGLLDGNGDGVPGDDFTTKFSVPSPTGVVVSIPDFARGPSQSVNVPVTATTGVPLRLSNGSGITNITLKLRYDSKLLTITAASVTTAVPPGSTVTINTSTPDVATLTFTSPTALASGERNFVTLTAMVPDNARYGLKHILDLTDIQINNGAIGARDDDGIHVVGYFGDATGNARITSTDATRTFRVAIGLDHGFAAYPLADPRLVADINGDRRISSIDATMVLREAIGIDQSAIPPLPANPPTITGSGPDPLLSISSTFRSRPGDVLTVPVYLDRSEGLESADLALSFDPRRLEVLEIRRGSVTADFDVFLANLDPAVGTIRVGLGRTFSPIEDRGGGSVVEIVVRIRPDAPPGRAYINLRHGLGQTMTQLNEGSLVLNPEPADRGGDELDGLVLVRRKVRRVDALNLAGLISTLLKRPRES